MGDAPRLAYLTTAYPNVSHTFIRREIQGMERLGYSIFRVAIRSGTIVADAEDATEDAQTLHVLSQPKAWMLRQVLRGVIRVKGKLFKGLLVARTLNRSSERGWLRHTAYLMEALILVPTLGDEAIEHVHVHFGTNAAAVAMLMKTMGGPTFSMTVHGPDEFDAPIGLSLGWKMREAAFTIAISHFCASQLRRWVPPAEWEKIHIVHCTVDDDWFEAARPVDAGADSIVCVGRLSEQKGHLLLLEAFAIAAERGFAGRLVFVGDGAMRETIENRITAYGLSSKVEVTGWCDGSEVRRHLLDARALVLSSFAEGLPMVLMEAMALQRPVLCSSIMGIPELVHDREHGWLVIAGDEGSLADALCELGTTPLARLHEIGRAAQKPVRERHTMRELEKLHSLFRVQAADG